MKFNFVKAIISLALAALIGLLCFVIAKEDANRHWISLATATVSICLCLGSAIAFDYNCGARKVNMKVSAWIFTVIVMAANLIFSCFAYNVIVYPVVLAILSLLDVAVVYSMYKPEGNK